MAGVVSQFGRFVVIPDSRLPEEVQTKRAFVADPFTFLKFKKAEDISSFCLSISNPSLKELLFYRNCLLTLAKQGKRVAICSREDYRFLFDSRVEFYKHDDMMEELLESFDFGVNLQNCYAAYETSRGNKPSLLPSSLLAGAMDFKNLRFKLPFAKKDFPSSSKKVLVVLDCLHPSMSPGEDKLIQLAKDLNDAGIFAVLSKGPGPEGLKFFNKREQDLVDYVSSFDMVVGPESMELYIAATNKVKTLWLEGPHSLQLVCSYFENALLARAATYRSCSSPCRLEDSAGYFCYGAPCAKLKYHWADVSKSIIQAING